MSVTPIRDLHSTFGPARCQGSRPACCAFACSDLHAAERTPWLPLSCEYLYYHSARRQGTGPDEGLALHHVLDAVHQDGQPEEMAWPYQPVAPADPANWAPPVEIGPLYHAKGQQSLGASDTIRTEIDQERPVVVVMNISDAFYLGFDEDGVIDSEEPVDPTRVHAVVAVGHGTREAEPVTLVRNSWGQQWGIRGYAWLADRYLAPRILELATLRKVA
jgi:hypothetical protein